MLINLQPAILFHRYSDIYWTNKHEIMKGYSYIPDIDVTEDLKKREVEKYEQAMKAERQHLEIVGPDDI